MAGNDERRCLKHVGPVYWPHFCLWPAAAVSSR